MSLKEITELSRFYGSNPEFVLAGGGNTSFKDDKHLYVKPSGVSLADIKESDFVKMDRALLMEIFRFQPPDDSAEREDRVKKMMALSVCPGSSGRPSVEAPLHEIMPFKFVVHLHPAAVNGMTCGKSGQSKCRDFFPDALWVEYTDPGFTLAKTVFDAAGEYQKASGKAPSVIFLQNHGVFVGADSVEGVRAAYDKIMSTLMDYYKKSGVSAQLETGRHDHEAVLRTSPRLRTLLGDESGPATVTSLPPFNVSEGPLTPDHIVYAKSFALASDSPDKGAVETFVKNRGYRPLVVSVPGKAVFCAGKTAANALTTAELAKDAGLVQQLAGAFGGPIFLSPQHRSFIENWEVESYRKQVSSGGGAGRLGGKVTVVTGGAQGFGYGIAEELVKAGSVVAVADLNIKGAEKAAEQLCASFGRHKAFAFAVDISNEDSVAAMVDSIIVRLGGLDVFVANAGVLKAGSVKTLEKKDWDFVTNVNYTGFFLCAKHAARAMAAQNAEGDSWTDIIQINSKSGLEGSNKNGAYAGSKFGGIGLTQSFAMELVEDKIKVNAICPGNFYDGPLWSDPEKGLFVQYLKSGKVPGAKTVEDVRKFYEAKTPIRRGCTPADVGRAIIYSIEQQYETGQAIPVTGGQVMLS